MINSKRDKLKFPIRIVYIGLVAFYVYTLRDHFAYKPISFLTLVRWTILGAIFNSGIWIITTKWARRWKRFSFLLYLPTLIVSPILLPWGGWAPALIYYSLALMVLIIYFPWSKNDSISTIS